MNTVELKKNGSLFSDGKPVTDAPLACLGFQVVLETGATLRSLFAMLQKYPLLARLNAFLPSYLQQYDAAPPSGCICDDFKALALSKTVELIGHPGEPRLEIYTSLQGVGAAEPKEIRNYALEQLLDMPLVLGRLKHIVFGDQVDQFEFGTVFNLFEFIDGVVWELSFHGTLRACTLRR